MRRGYAHDIIGDLPVAEIDTSHLLRILRPIWLAKNETAGRVRIENVLDFAKARGARQDENPARWRCHLENLLAKPSEVQQPQHHPALPYRDAPAFMAELRTVEAMAARNASAVRQTTTKGPEITRPQGLLVGHVLILARG